MKIQLLTLRKTVCRVVAATTILVAASTYSDESADRPASESFTVQQGHLSANVQRLVNSYHWYLKWDSEEDRIIDYPFEISNRSLEDGINSLLAIYQGAFVADIYAKNQVVQIVTPSPRIEIELLENGQAILTIPLFLMRDLAEARVERDFLEGLGYEVHLEESSQDEEVWHRVSVRYRSESESKILEELEILGYEIPASQSSG